MTRLAYFANDSIIHASERHLQDKNKSMFLSPSLCRILLRDGGHGGGVDELPDVGPVPPERGLSLLQLVEQR